MCGLDHFGLATELRTPAAIWFRIARTSHPYQCQLRSHPTKSEVDSHQIHCVNYHTRFVTEYPNERERAQFSLANSLFPLQKVDGRMWSAVIVVSARLSMQNEGKHRADFVKLFQMEMSSVLRLRVVAMTQGWMPSEGEGKEMSRRGTEHEPAFRSSFKWPSLLSKSWHNLWVVNDAIRAFKNV
jgi:hypothetical protein